MGLMFFNEALDILTEHFHEQEQKMYATGELRPDLMEAWAMILHALGSEEEHDPPELGPVVVERVKQGRLDVTRIVFPKDPDEKGD